ncbi:hypothetical protein [Snodgrassella sp. B3837]|uniref:hypothetical protein n=1 Tax=Snodgrassella sp. B3837 TaxID=2818040 RepID=UPI00226A73B3|nr:hypothetical protein [Snodgrassella sp. B3837]MCX8753784.1 hypothetical protein [Snodgrassella sp. B3837]
MGRWTGWPRVTACASLAEAKLVPALLAMTRTRHLILEQILRGRLKAEITPMSWATGCLPLLISRTTMGLPPMRTLLDTLTPPAWSSVTLASQVLRSLLRTAGWLLM